MQSTLGHAVPVFTSDFCERIAPGWWAEPVNVLTSLAFVAGAAWLTGDVLRTPAGMVPGGRWSLLLLVALCASIGLGSVALHVTASPWGATLDMLAIRCFLLWVVACFLRWMLGWSWPRALLGMPVFYLLAQAWFELAHHDALFGLHSYLPALWALLACTAVLWARGDTAWRCFALAAAGHGASLAFHRLDRELCEWLPLGTHFLWHLVNAGLTFAVARCIVRRACGEQAAGGERPVPVAR